MWTNEVSCTRSGKYVIISNKIFLFLDGGSGSVYLSQSLVLNM